MTDCNLSIIHANTWDIRRLQDEYHKGYVLLEAIYQYDKREEFCCGPKFLMKESDFPIALQRMTGTEPIVDLTDLVIRTLDWDSLT